MLHSAILSTFIKLPFVFEIFVLPILSGPFTQILLYIKQQCIWCAYMYMWFCIKICNVSFEGNHLFFETVEPCKLLQSIICDPSKQRVVSNCMADNIDQENIYIYIYIFFFYLIWFFTSKSTIFQLCRDGFPVLNQLHVARINVLLKDTTQWRWCSTNPQPLGLESSTLPLSHCAPKENIYITRVNIWNWQYLLFVDHSKLRTIA